MGESHKSRGLVSRLTQAEIWMLGKWLADIELTYDDSRESLAQAASEKCSRVITAHNIDSVLEMIGKKIPRANDPLPQDESIKLLAQCVRLIANQLGITMPSKLEDI